MKDATYRAKGFLRIKCPGAGKYRNCHGNVWWSPVSGRISRHMPLGVGSGQECPWSGFSLHETNARAAVVTDEEESDE